jgi:uncharacterized membrane protein YhaH (DUF805 family)
MYCAKCGKPLAPDANFCPACGAPNENVGQETANAAQQPARQGRTGCSNGEIPIAQRNIIDNYIYCTKNCFDFSGRASRKEYWCFFLANFIIGIIAELLWQDLSIIIFIVTLIPSLAVFVRRLHDIGKSGWWGLISFVPIANLYLIYLLVKPSDRADNEYGQNPYVLQQNT